MADPTPSVAAEQDLEGRLRQRERQLQAVISVTEALQAHLDLDELVRHAVLTAMATVDADAGSLILHDPERRTLVFRHVEGPAKEKITGMEIAEGQGIAGEVFRTGEPRISQDVRSEQSHILDVDRAAQYQTLSMITVPLNAGAEDAIGVLQVLNKRTGPFDEEDMAVLEVLATQVAAAIINARLFEKAKAAAIVDMMGQLSHDIKNFLTPVSMAGQTLRIMLDDFQRKMAESLSALPAQDAVPAALGALASATHEDMIVVLDILEESTQVAQQRSREIADAVKGLSAPPAYEAANLDEVAHRVCGILHWVAEQHGVALTEELGDTPQLLLDAKRMYNAIYNLANNAISATPNGGRVTVRTFAHAAGVFPEGGFVGVEVRDTGSGMPPDVAEKLFTGQVRSTKRGGTGLGTRVVKNVVDAHGGRLTVDSAPGCGTAITAYIPIRGG